MRKKTLLLVIVGVLATASAAFAGWQLFSGLDGGTSGTFSSPTTSTAVHLSTATVPAIGAGDSSGPVELDGNNVSTVGQQILAANITSAFTTKDSSGNNNTATCAQYLHDTFTISGSGIIPAGTSGQIGTVTFTLDPAAPVGCAGGTWAVTFTGTTVPQAT